MIKHSSSILKFHTERQHKYSYHSCLVLYSCYYPMQLCGVLITGAILLAHPKSSSLVSHPCYVHNIVSHSIVQLAYCVDTVVVHSIL